jgi:hypothetical protein
MLRCSVVVLLGGLGFASGAFGDENTVGSTILSLFVGTLVVGASALFVTLIALETREMVLSRRADAASAVVGAPQGRQESAVLAEQLLRVKEQLLQPGGSSRGGRNLVVVNPMHAGRRELPTVLCRDMEEASRLGRPLSDSPLPAAPAADAGRVLALEAEVAQLRARLAAVNAAHAATAAQRPATVATAHTICN